MNESVLLNAIKESNQNIVSEVRHSELATSFKISNLSEDMQKSYHQLQNQFVSVSNEFSAYQAQSEKKIERLETSILNLEEQIKILERQLKQNHTNSGFPSSHTKHNPQATPSKEEKKREEKKESAQQKW